MPAVVEASAVANVSKETLWNVIADFPNIADHVDSVKASAAIGEQISGVGATRRCDLQPLGRPRKKSSNSNPATDWLSSCTRRPAYR